MKIPMPAAVLAGGASRRMGRPKAALAYGAGTLLEFQTSRLSDLFAEVFAILKEAPTFAVGPARVLLDGEREHAAIFGLVRALDAAADRVFVLAVDQPGVAPALLRAIADRSVDSAAAAVLPRADAKLQALAGVWRRKALPAARRRIAEGALSLHGLAQEVGVEVVEEAEWRRFDPSGQAFANLNTLEQYAAHRERA